MVEPEVTLHEVVAEILSRRGASQPVLVVGRDQLADVTVPVPVAEALAGAAAEALRNVVRHAGTDAAELVVRVPGSSVRIDVQDRGVGLPESFAPGFGVGSSIVARMQEVGGSAVVSSRPGGGTLVRLSWAGSNPSNDELADTYSITMATTGGGQIVARVGYPLLVAQIYLAIRFSLASQHPGPSLFLATGLVATTVFVIRLLGRRSPTARELVAWALFMSATMVGGLFLAGPGASLSFESWVVGFAQLSLSLMSYVVPLRWLPVLTVPPLIAVTVCVVLDPMASLSGAIGVPLAAALPAALVWAVGAGVRRSVRALAVEHEVLVAASAASQGAAYLAEARARHLDHSVNEIVPFLEGVAAADFPVDDVARSRAHMYGLEARDDLYVPGFYSTSLRSEVSDFRRRGGQLSLRPGLEPGGYGRTSGQLLEALMRCADATCRITLSPPVDGERHTRIAVVPALSTDALKTLQSAFSGTDAALSGDDFATVARFTDIPRTGDVVRQSLEGSH